MRESATIAHIAAFPLIFFAKANPFSKSPTPLTTLFSGSGTYGNTAVVVRNELTSPVTEKSDICLRRLNGAKMRAKKQTDDEIIAIVSPGRSFDLISPPDFRLVFPEAWTK